MFYLLPFANPQGNGVRISQDAVSLPWHTWMGKRWHQPTGHGISVVKSSFDRETWVLALR